MRELAIPDAACRDEHSIEILRAWIAEKALWCSVHVGMYRETSEVSEAKAWGIILADATRHIATALADRYGDEPTGTEGLIKESF